MVECSSKLGTSYQCDFHALCYHNGRLVKNSVYPCEVIAAIHRENSMQVIDNYGG